MATVNDVPEPAQMVAASGSSVIGGAGVGVTVTVNEQVGAVPMPFEAVTSTVVGPAGNAYGNVIGLPPTE